MTLDMNFYYKCVSISFKCSVKILAIYGDSGIVILSIRVYKEMCQVNVRLSQREGGIGLHVREGIWWSQFLIVLNCHFNELQCTFITEVHFLKELIFGQIFTLNLIETNLGRFFPILLVSIQL